MKIRHVVLLTYGEPPRASFFSQLRYSWRILLGLTRSVADIPAILLPLIALMRAATRATMWTRERFRSPLEFLTRSQAAELLRALRERRPEIDWRVHVAYEFRDPLLLDCVAALPADEPVDVVPMYAADSAFTHQLARETLAAGERRGGRRRAAPRVLPPISTEELAEINARHLRTELAACGIHPDRGCALVLAAHGTLLEPPRPYETGRVATEALAAAIERRMESTFGRVQLAWLNHSFGGRWTEPAAPDALRLVADAGFVGSPGTELEFAL